ncbi:MAG: hypothetical protein HOV81_40465, partial [Kofleriaceae bacterium]|nr:hypothetical protein [Kofleriaceae bacterium]
MGEPSQLSSAFIDLRRLADWFASLGADSSLPVASRSALVERVIRRLGARCIPMLGRELESPVPARREAARSALATLAKQHDADGVRVRVLAELRRIARGAGCDEGKVSALGLLAEHGERAAARFTDPGAMQRRSALALASQLDNEADIAAAADMMIHQLGHDEMMSLLTVMVEASAGAAYHLAAELCARLDLDADVRERIAQIALGGAAPLPVVGRAPRPTSVSVLLDPHGRCVVIAQRKVSGERRWRRWAVLIGTTGSIEDCIHEDDVTTELDRTPLVASLVSDGYEIVSCDLARARGIVAAAARLASDAPEGRDRLTSAYYLGRDLLDLGEAHLGGRVHAHPTSTSLGRAVELIADGDLPRAQVLLARCADSADVAAAQGACLIAQNRPADALEHLARAADLEPDFPLHHYNLACALHALGNAPACYAALRRFIATSANPTGLYADPDQPGRVALASRLMADLERSARLTG